MNKSYVIGASGLIGGALLDLLKEESIDVIGTYSKNKEKDLVFFDITNPDYSCFGQIREGDIFYLLSAYSNPSWIAQNKLAAEELNYTKTIKLIRFLIEKRAKIIFMSSVEIFDGKKGGYKEDDTPDPLNFYGTLKLKVEDYLVNNYDNYTIARTGWNVGLNEKSRCVVRLTYETLLEKNARMASDNFFSLASVEDTTLGLYKASLKKDLKKIHLGSDEIVNRMGMAKLIMEISNKGSEMDFSECLFKDILYSEPRGRVNDLDNSLSRELLDLNYVNANELILKKVHYLDSTDNV